MMSFFPGHLWDSSGLYKWNTDGELVSVAIRPCEGMMSPPSVRGPRHLESGEGAAAELATTTRTMSCLTSSSSPRRQQ